METWRLVRSRTLGFSFGYVVVNSTKRADGSRVLDEIDVYEVSATPTPMNGRTRVISWKSSERTPPTIEQLRDLERDLGLNPEHEQLKQRMREQMLAALGTNTNTNTNDREPKSLSHHALREQAERSARAHAPIVVASFEC